jgi:hypothetical protein
MSVTGPDPMPTGPTGPVDPTEPPVPPQPIPPATQPSLWQQIVNWFKNLFR